MKVLEMEANGIFESAMKGRWDEVVEAYEKNSSFQKARITRSEDTALHVAVSNGQTAVVLKLVEIARENASTILHIKNDKGNTPLHLAAALGNVKMCHFLATKDRSLIRARNFESETPLFLSALHGNKKAFLCLHSLYKEAYREIDYSLCRRSNGDTILHSAISGEYFSLAFQIIHDYPNLVNSINKDGLSPLHILASKPKAFKSGTHLPPLARLIYRCLIVHELQEETHDPEECQDNLGVKTGLKYPQNYETCMIYFHTIRSCFQVLTRKRENCIGHQVRQFLFPPKTENDNLKDEENAQETSRLSHDRNIPRKEYKEKRLYPPNYATISHFFKFMVNALLIILGFGISKIKNIREKKERHIWAAQIMKELVGGASLYKYEDNGRDTKNSWPKRDGDPSEVFTEADKKSQNTDAKDIGLSSLTANQEKDQNGRDEHRREKNHKHTLITANLGVTEMENKFPEGYPSAIQELNTPQKNPVLVTFEDTQKSWKKETPILIAAKMGVTEIVDKILDTFPIAIQDLDSDKKNAVLLAVEHRQTDVYNLLLKRAMLKETVFRQLDNKGNSALHLAAKFGDHRPWLIPGAALQMQWEIKWYKFVKKSMTPHFFVKRNRKGQTAKEIFTVTHKDLVTKGNEWLTKTSESCSVVAALIATVAFATSATVPGGVNQDNGAPTLKNEPAFNVFAIASIIALCFSVTALIFFLTILTSRYQENDFAMDLPRKLFMGLTSLFTSIASMLLSFCAGHFFILKENLRYVAFPLYAATCLPMTFFALAQLPLYFDLVRAILNEVPQRSYRHKVSLTHSIHT
ncbi:hypothetical protein P3X46_006431 [Hevea brasiliensis]|uniref:PGG domain-containing protein n=2 Tax=Hevea brasiliensis TaxID=3981 RepID=A0ABQ9MTF8_HEVBR|nr:hypothetical protein P3X46_006431 [Hevea brasiliensis]